MDSSGHVRPLPGPARPRRVTEAPPPPARHRSRFGLVKASLDPLDLPLITMILALAIGTAWTVQFRAFAPRSDLAVATVAAILAPMIAVMGWLRYREIKDSLDLSFAAAGLVLTIAHAAALVHLLMAQDIGIQTTPLIQAPSYVAAAANLLVGVTLLYGIAHVLGSRHIRFPVLFLVAPAGVLLAVLALAPALESSLPALEWSPEIAGSASGVFVPPGYATTLGSVLQISLAALFAAAAALGRRSFLRRRWLGDAFSVVALILTAFGAAYAAVYSAGRTGYVSGADVLSVAFLLTLLLGLAAGAHATHRALRMTNASLRVTRRHDAARAGLEERSRLARELHDGLAQDLWVAKLKVGRLLSLSGLKPEVAELSGELNSAIESGLAEARQAVMALRVPDDASFSELLSRYVDDFSDGFGLRAEFECDAPLPPLEPATQAELMRIAQEALNNARRHAYARLVRVSVLVQQDHLRLRIDDDGRGFDHAAIRRGAFGLASMRERAALIGGQLRITSTPQHGTSVSVDLPVPDANAVQSNAQS